MKYIDANLYDTSSFTKEDYTLTDLVNDIIGNRFYMPQTYERYIENVRHDLRALTKMSSNAAFYKIESIDTRILRCVDLSNDIANEYGYSDPDFFSIACSKGYKVVLVASKELINGHKLMHWYRQDSNGVWSHKLEDNYITNLDSSGKIITDPRTCDKNYDNIEYEYVGCFETVPMYTPEQRELLLEELGIL